MLSRFVRRAVAAMAAELARKWLAGGVKLNYPEAIALIYYEAVHCLNGRSSTAWAKNMRAPCENFIGLL